MDNKETKNIENQRPSPEIEVAELNPTIRERIRKGFDDFRETHEISWKKTLAASLLVTSVVNFGLGIAGKNPKLTSPDTRRTEISTTYKGSKAPELDEIVQPQTHKEKIVTQSKENSVEYDFNDMEWARFFSSSPEARQLNEGKFNALSDTLVDILFKDGVEDLKVSITGKSSAEDRSNTNAGLTERSQENQELAQTRLNAFVDALNKRISDKNTELPQDSIHLDVEEDVFDTDQLRTTIELADKFGYDSAETMIHQWNINPADSPPIVNQWLTETLSTNRGVQVEISYSTTEGQESVIVEEVPGKCIYIDGKIYKRVVITKGHDSSEMLIPIPIFVPIFRRKREEEDNSESEPLDYEPEMGESADATEKKSGLVEKGLRAIEQKRQDIIDRRRQRDHEQAQEAWRFIEEEEARTRTRSMQDKLIEKNFFRAIDVNSSKEERQEARERMAEIRAEINRANENRRNTRKTEVIALTALTVVALVAGYFKVEVDADCILNKFSISKEANSLALNIDMNPACQTAGEAAEEGTLSDGRQLVCPVGFEEIHRTVIQYIP